MNDIFICHASEDKACVVRPLTEAFDENGITYWVDEAEIHWGDSITDKVNEGLRTSKYVVVVLSPAFVEKRWPQRELNAVLNIEASSGEVKVLPLLVGSTDEQSEILRAFPLLNDKLHIPWNGSPEVVVKAFLKRLNRPITLKEPSLIHNDIHIPKIRREFSDKEKHDLLRSAFNDTREYFQQGLELLSSKHSEVDTAFEEIEKYKFIARIYISGKLAMQCQIWIMSDYRHEQIAFSENPSGFSNSYNDSLGVDSDGYKIFIKSHMGMNSTSMSPHDAATYLWDKFTAGL